MNREQQARAEIERAYSEWYANHITTGERDNLVRFALLTFSKAPEGSVIDDKGETWRIAPGGINEQMELKPGCFAWRLVLIRDAAHPTGVEVE